MRLRPILTVGCLLAVATATVASAAPTAKPKPVCKLVVDPANDQVSGKPYDPSLDVLSADVANDANTVTAVIRVAKMTADDNLAPSGRYYKVNWVFRSTGQNGSLDARITPTGNQFAQGDGTGVVDLAKNEIRISMPISRMVGHPLFKSTEALINIQATADLTWPSIPADAPYTHTYVPLTFSTLGDTAATTKIYPAGAPSCVKVGA